MQKFRPCEFDKVALTDIPRKPNGIFFASKNISEWWNRQKFPPKYLSKLLGHISSAYSPKQMHCLPETEVNLSLEQTQPIIYILLIGLTIGGLFIMMETLIHKFWLRGKAKLVKVDQKLELQEKILRGDYNIKFYDSKTGEVTIQFKELNFD